MSLGAVPEFVRLRNLDILSGSNRGSNPRSTSVSSSSRRSMSTTFPGRNLLQHASFLAAVLALSGCAFASLGGDLSSVQDDQAHMRAQRRVLQSKAYSIHEMQIGAGTTVREFVSPQGRVFGVSWQGPVRPDLQQVFGSYYQEFLRAAPTRRVRGPITIETPNLVIQSGGHMRALTGRAYVPAMLPSNVKAEEIK